MRPERSNRSAGINISRDGKTGLVALGPANYIAVVYGAPHQVRKYLLVGQRVWHMAFTPHERYLLTTNGASNDISINGSRSSIRSRSPKAELLGQTGWYAVRMKFLGFLWPALQVFQ